jgi:hypothetical protein
MNLTIQPDRSRAPGFLGVFRVLRFGSADRGGDGRTRTACKSGSVLIVAMILGVALTMMAGGYILLTSQSMRLTQRTFYLSSALNLAESGAEHALWCLKNGWTLPSGDWTGDSSTKNYVGSSTSPVYIDNQGSKGFFKVRVTEADTLTPTIIAEGVVVPPTGEPISKQIRVQLSNSGLFSHGLVAKENLVLNGGEIDSYRSSLGDPENAARGYEITVASAAVDIGDVSMGSAADIYGYVAIGSSDESGFIDSFKGHLVGPTTEPGDDGVVSKGGNTVDTNRIAYDFTQDFPDATVPEIAVGTIVATALPPPNSQGVIVIGNPDGTSTVRYQLSSVNIPDGLTLMVVGPVEFDVTTSFTVGGGASMVVLDGTTTVSTNIDDVVVHSNYTGAGTARLYVAGDISISGNGGITAPYAPEALQVYGTLSKADYDAGFRQSIRIGGNGSFAGALYAPNADIVMNGGGSTGYMAGAAVGRSVRINGNGYRFRYDKDLENLANGLEYRVTAWAELIQPSDRYQLGVELALEQPPTTVEVPPSTGTGTEPVSG